jgi:hypothetical protein
MFMIVLVCLTLVIVHIWLIFRYGLVLMALIVYVVKRYAKDIEMSYMLLYKICYPLKL